MKKPLSGKRWFYAMGQRSLYPDYTGPLPDKTWKPWAGRAFLIGRDDERWARATQEVKTWSPQKMVDSLKTGEERES